MKLKRVPEQQNETLEETYMKFGEGPGPFWPQCAEMMLALIQYLEEHNIGADKWVSTSHHDLVFGQNPSARDVTVVASAWAGVYTVEYRLPPEDAPWPNARVIGDTGDLAETGQMLLKAFERVFKNTHS